MVLELSRTTRNWLSVVFSLLALVAGMRFVGHYRTMSQERRTALEQAKIYESLLDTEDFAVIATDANGKIRIWNPAATKLFGWTHDEMLGQEMYRLLPPELVPMHKKIFEAGRTGEMYRAHTVRCITSNSKGVPLDVLLTIRTIPVNGARRVMVAIDSPALHQKAPAAVEQVMNSTRNVLMIPPAAEVNAQ